MLCFRINGREFTFYFLSSQSRQPATNNLVVLQMNSPVTEIEIAEAGSTAADPAQTAGADSTKGLNTGTVSVRVADMVTGRVLQSPVYDNSGVLLLAPGSIITPRFKQLLKRREIDNVQASPADAETLIAPESDDLEACVADLDEFVATHELTKKLDTLIESGSLFVKNSGPPVSRSVVLHGCKGYDANARKQLEERHRTSAKALDSMMRHSINGGEGAAEQIAQFAGHYLTSLTADMDLLLSTANAAGQDATLAQHCLQMSTLGMAIAVEMGYDAENVQRVGICGLVHDWGMLRVDPGLRNKARLLTPIEFYELKKHPIYSLELLQQVSGMPGTIALACYQIHERPNGTGYPRGREGSSIHPFARILQVADIYAALTSPRPWRAPLMPYSAMECLLSKAAVGEVDHEVVQKLLMTMSLFPPGSLIELSDRSVAISLRRNGLRYAQPIVRLIRLANGKRAEGDEDSLIINLAETDLKVTRAIPYPGRNEIPLTTEILESDQR